MNCLAEKGISLPPCAQYNKGSGAPRCPAVPAPLIITVVTGTDKLVPSVDSNYTEYYCCVIGGRTDFHRADIKDC